MELKIFGHSDDLVELRGVVDDEIGCYDRPVHIIINDTIDIEMAYRSPGIWTPNIRAVGDEPIPEWFGVKIEIYRDHDYSLGVRVTGESFDVKVGVGDDEPEAPTAGGA